MAIGSFVAAMLSAMGAIETADRRERDGEVTARAFERASVVQRIASFTIPAGLALSGAAIVLLYVHRKPKPPDAPEV